MDKVTNFFNACQQNISHYSPTAVKIAKSALWDYTSAALKFGFVTWPRICVLAQPSNNYLKFVVNMIRLVSFVGLSYVGVIFAYLKGSKYINWATGHFNSPSDRNSKTAKQKYLEERFSQIGPKNLFGMLIALEDFANFVITQLKLEHVLKVDRTHRLLTISMLGMDSIQHSGKEISSSVSTDSGYSQLIGDVYLASDNVAHNEWGEQDVKATYILSLGFEPQGYTKDITTVKLLPDKFDGNYQTLFDNYLDAAKELASKLGSGETIVISSKTGNSDAVAVATMGYALHCYGNNLDEQRLDNIKQVMVKYRPFEKLPHHLNWMISRMVAMLNAKEGTMNSYAMIDQNIINGVKDSGYTALSKMPEGGVNLPVSKDGHSLLTMAFESYCRKKIKIDAIIKMHKKEYGGNFQRACENAKALNGGKEYPQAIQALRKLVNSETELTGYIK